MEDLCQRPQFIFQMFSVLEIGLRSIFAMAMILSLVRKRQLQQCCVNSWKGEGGGGDQPKVIYSILVAPTVPRRVLPPQIVLYWILEDCPRKIKLKNILYVHDTDQPVPATVLLNFQGAQVRFQRDDSASLAGRYDNLIPSIFRYS
jgi:hypothetical protein